MSRIRWGLLGAGRISGWFATGLSVLPDDAELYAIASRDLNKAQAFAEKFDRARRLACSIYADVGQWKAGNPLIR